MQTHFSQEQLLDSDIKRADDILRKCVHCGFCTATCPSYVVTGDERDSPRGRIWMIRDLLENEDADAGAASHHLDRCLTCLSCMSTCPSGVDYMHLVDIGRKHSEARHQRGIADRLKRRFLTSVMPHAERAHAVLTLGWIFRPLRSLFPKPLSSMLEVVPSSRPRFDFVGAKDRVFSPDATPPKARVILLTGCAQRAIDPDINAATIRVLNRIGVEVVVKKQAHCCGAIAHHTGDETAAVRAMTSTIKAWADEERHQGIDGIVINTSGCGTTVKDYGDYFSHDDALKEDAEMVSEMAMDISECLERYGFDSIKIDARKTEGVEVAYHGACSLQHGQSIKTLPKELLSRAGFSVTDIADSHLCCGSAGVYNVLEPEIARDLKARKLKAINDTEADIVAAGNLGCINQLSESAAPILHVIQLLDWASGGVKPTAMRSFNRD